MPRYLITQSLLSAWLYCYGCFEGYEEDAFNSFLDTLNRVPSEQNEAMKAGSDFERFGKIAKVERSAHFTSLWISGKRRSSSRSGRADFLR